MSRRPALLPGLVAAVLLLGACGGTDDPMTEVGAGPSAGASGTPAPAGPAVPAVPEVPEALSDDLADLAELAEQQAGEVPGSRIPPERGPVLGSDISWPQCPVGLGIPEKRTLGMPGPLPQARYVVIGLTNGPGFYPNPCLADQVAAARAQGLLVAAYAVASYPEPETLARLAAEGPYDGGDPLGALRNVGVQQARFNVASMREAGLETPIVWIDVEPVPDFAWSGDPVANAAVVEGLARGYTEAGYRIGVYSTPLLWEGVVGGFALGVPEWRAAGQTSAEEALSRCGDDWSIQGGPAVMGQWVEADRDQNLTCPGISADLGLWFHRYPR